ncbi:TetR/AcrR family transcriptional regulator [Paraburkholderia sp.]|uniref:TetR/AcrR family transcriptional regulator n=1 Tax=Paraburkholderia sp. TaxID=1926495 RepID=UPI002D5726CB|nr:TetR/AcrR family transcriptional regulator [Paraburkholderia sp.]HZZ06091.1 TetR/AcrR family transcriptional regulator [Paraburkholderia sp.]
MGIVERKNRQKQALRERILDAARRIVMREGFAALSMRKIADAIEYSPATLYLHFASRDEIVQALCAEGYAQLLETFVPLAQIADPADRLNALGRAYVAFGVAHPETYRLIFMEDPSYTGAALGGAAGVSGASVAAVAEASAAGEQEAVTAAGTAVAASTASGKASLAPPKPDDDPGDAALHIMISALEELKAAGRLTASTDLTVWAEAFWATLHGIVALNLTCPVFPTAPLDTVLNVALDAWLGTQGTGQQARVANASLARKKKSTEARVEARVEPGESHVAQGGKPATQASQASAASDKKSTKPPGPSAIKPTDADTNPAIKVDTKPVVKPTTRPKATSA